MTGSSLSLYSPSEQVALAADIWPLANRLAKTDFVPKPLRDKPEAVMAAMLKGTELGIPLMSSLSQIHVIEGRPTMSSELMRAVVQSRGHDIFIEESNSTRCVVVGRRSGTDRDQKFTWSIDDARAAGLLGKQVWKSYPAAMLLARATGVLCRAVFADCLAGISYTREELEDGEDTVAMVFDPSTGEVQTPAPKGRTAKARQAATRGSTAAAEVPDVSAPNAPKGAVPPLPGEEDIVDAEVIVDEPDATADEAPAAGIDRPETSDIPEDDFPPYVDPDPVIEQPDSGSRMSGPSRIAMLMNQHGVADRAGKQGAVFQIVGRQIESTKELSAEEMSMVIAFMSGLAEGEAFPFDDVGEGVPVPVPNPDAKAADVVETSSTVPAPPPPQRRTTPVPDAWSADDWREFLKKRGMKPTQIIPEVKRLAALKGLSVVTLDEIAGTGIADDVIGWVEDNTVSKP